MNMLYNWLLDTKTKQIYIYTCNDIFYTIYEATLFNEAVLACSSELR